MSKIKWKYDPAKFKDGTESKAILYGDDGKFMITTHYNRLFTRRLSESKEVVLTYYGVEEKWFWGELNEMKELAQEIKDNEKLIKRYLDMFGINQKLYNGPNEVETKALCWWTSLPFLMKEQYEYEMFGNKDPYEDNTLCDAGIIKMYNEFGCG
jgi:hypothetical protein